jgi:uncharacterized membrane protein YhaH (DUF805 family)
MPIISARFNYMRMLNANNYGRFLALLVSLIALIAFGIAICTRRYSDHFVRNHILITHTDIVFRFHRDYIWMFPAILMTLSFALLVGFIRQKTFHEKKYSARRH